MSTLFVESTFLPRFLVALRDWWRRWFSRPSPKPVERIEPGIYPSEAIKMADPIAAPAAPDSRLFNVYIGRMTVKRVREDGSEADFTSTEGVTFSNMSYAKFHALQAAILKLQADLHAAVAPAE